MFNLSKLDQTWPICGIKSINTAIKTASQIWYLGGHLFIVDKQSKKVTSQDVLPADKVWMNSRRQTLLETIKTNQDVLTIVQISTSIYLLVMTNGDVHSWLYDRNSYSWLKKDSWNLIAPEGGHLVSLLNHPGTNSLNWCEAAVEYGIEGKTMTYCICSANFQRDTITLTEETLGQKSVLLTQCQPCDLYAIGEALLIFLREPCPPGVFFKWQPHKLILEVHVHPKGCVSTYKKLSQILNMEDIIQECTAFWALAQSVSSLLRVMDYNNESMICITNDGKVYQITSADGMRHISSLIETSAIGPDTKSVIVKENLVILQDQIRIYELTSGTLRQQIRLPSDEEHILDFTVAYGAVPQFLLLTNKDIYIIRRNTALEFTSHQTRPIQMVLEEVYDLLQNSTVCKDSVSWAKILQGVHFQSPALLIGLLCEYRTKNPVQTADLQHVVNEMLSTPYIEYEHTDLFQKSGPYIDHFWKLEQQKRDLFSVRSRSSSQTTEAKEEKDEKNHPKDEGLVEALLYLRPSSGYSLEARCAQLEILADKYPLRLLQTMLKYLDAKNTADHSRWNSLLCLGDKQGTKDDCMPLFDLLCRLMFFHLPKQLAQIVQAAQIVYNKQTDRSAFLSKERNLAQRVLRILPDPRKSHNVTAAVMATVDLIIASNVDEAELKSLHILLEHRLWSAAILLVKQQDMDVRRELYDILLETAAKEGVLAQYCSQILALTPDTVSFEELLEQIVASTKQRVEPDATDGDDVSIFATGANTMTIGSIRPYLVAKLSSHV